MLFNFVPLLLRSEKPRTWILPKVNPLSHNNMCEKSKVLKSCLVKCSFSRNRAGSPPLLFRLGLLVRPLQIIGSLSHRGWKRQHQGAQVDKLATVDNLKLWKKSSLPLWLDLQLYKERIIMRRSIKCTKPYMDPWYYFESTNVNLFCITGIKVGVQQESCSNHYSEQLSCWTPTLFLLWDPVGPPGGPRELGEDPSRPKIEKN